MLSEFIATVELIPYHSKIMTNDMQSKLLKCDSVRMLKEFMKDDIIPHLREDQILCMMRLFKSWGITPDKVGAKKNIIFNPNPRNPTLNVGKPFGKKILDHIGVITDKFTK